MKKQNLIKKISIIVFIGIILNLTNILNFNILEITAKSNITNDYVITEDLDSIYIDGNDELATFIGNKGLSGDGSIDNPYTIENYHIYARYTSGIEIRNTDAYLIIQNCKIEEDEFDHYYGIFLNNTVNVNINNNIMLNHRSGIYLENSNNNTLIENNASYNRWNGIYLKNSSNNILSMNNSIYNDWCGIYLENSNNNSLIENYASYNKKYGMGFLLEQSRNNTLSGNFVGFNENYGINLDNSSNNTITENNCDGINLSFSNNNIFLANNVSNNNSFGFLLGSSNNNILSGNNVNNVYEGVRLENCDNNLIFFNDFYEYEIHPSNEDGNCNDNRWDNGTTGNFWGRIYLIRYPDAENDGTIWDTPYEIDGEGSGIDNFPLVNPVTTDELIEGMEKKISSFSLINLIFFISVGVFLLNRKIKN